MLVIKTQFPEKIYEKTKNLTFCPLNIFNELQYLHHLANIEHLFPKFKKFKERKLGKTFEPNNRILIAHISA